MSEQTASEQTAGRGRRVRLSRAEREPLMVAAAEDVFAERGYRAATMDEVAARAGITKPMLYDYFGSKEGLLLACIARARTELRAATEQAPPEAADPQELFRASVHAFFTFIDSHGGAWAMLLNEAMLEAGPAAEEVARIRQQQVELTAARIERLPGGARLDDAEREAWSDLVVSACERLAVWRARSPGEQQQRPGGRPRLDTDRAVDLVMAALWPGLQRLQRPV
ncbi:MAG: TetR/AcrR family transcriptional regulator [Actinomycetes bacterium]